MRGPDLFVFTPLCGMVKRMRYFGIDYGTKRIGIALSDPEGKIAFPQKTAENKGAARALKELAAVIRKGGAAKIIVGLPVGLDGKETAQTRVTRLFAEALAKKTGYTVILENEMFTTRMVRQQGVKEERADAAAAAVILKS